MNIETLPVDRLIPYARNARTHSPEQVAQIAASISEFGFCNPVLIDAQDGIIAGHGRVMAARKLGMQDVPCVRLGHLTDVQRRAYILADNRLALSAGWDDEMLALELSALSLDGFDLDLTGFDAGEVDALLDGVDDGLGGGDEGADTEPDVDRAEELREKWGVESGQMWALGDHRLLCGDSTRAEDVARVMMGERADLCLTDPPYGIDFDPTKERGKLAKSISRPKIAGDKSTDAARAAWGAWKDICNDHVWFGGNYFTDFLPPSSCWFVWDKKNGGNDFADVEIAWTNLHRAARLFSHMWNGMLKDSERGERRVHGTQKPVALMEWCIEQVGGVSIIAEPFSGSGTTIIAGENLGRRVRAIEISPGYVGVTLERFLQHTGVTPVLLESA